MTPEERWPLLNIQDFALWGGNTTLSAARPPYEVARVYTRLPYENLRPLGFRTQLTPICGWYEWVKQ